MSAVLILTGLLLLLAGWAVLWWSSRHSHPGWLLLAVLPPLALLAGVLNIRRGWPGLLLILAGVGSGSTGLWQLHQQQPEQFARLTQLGWLQPARAADTGVQGVLQGRSLRFERVTLHEGVLLLAEGDSFLDAVEIRLHLDSSMRDWQGEPQVHSVLPDDRNAVPLLEVLGPDPDTGAPQVLRIQRGYTLSLQLQQQDEQFVGELFLSAPGQLGLRLEGRFQLLDYHPQSTAEQLPATPEPQVAQPLDTAQLALEVSLTALLQHPARYVQQDIQVELHSGKRINGRFQGLGDEGSILLHQQTHGAGFAVLELSPDDIWQVSRP